MLSLMSDWSDSMICGDVGCNVLLLKMSNSVLRILSFEYDDDDDDI